MDNKVAALILLGGIAYLIKSNTSNLTNTSDTSNAFEEEKEEEISNPSEDKEIIKKEQTKIEALSPKGILLLSTPIVVPGILIGANMFLNRVIDRMQENQNARYEALVEETNN